MAEQGSENGRDLPRVIVAQNVINKIVRGALLYPEPETGEAMIGLVVAQAGRAEPDIYVLETISPGEHAVREWGMFEQGDDWQGDVFHWLFVNWEAFRDLRRGSYGRALAAKWDVPLAHVGDWHKQPGDMIAPSGGDAQTARRMIADAETPVQHIVAPIVTMYPLVEAVPAAAAAAPTESALVPADAALPTAEAPAAAAPAAAEEAPAGDAPAAAAPPDDTLPADEDDVIRVPVPQPNTIVVDLPDKGWSVHIDFWYMSKRQKNFVAVVPEVWADDRLPKLPAIAWHLAHPRRFDQEYRLLADAGYTVDIVRFDADGKPPYEICFSVYRPGSSHVILLVTPVDYPAHIPAVRVSPLVSVSEGEDLFEKLYESSRPVLLTQMPDWVWDSKRTLIELVWHIENTLKEGQAS